jgi:hypothetical protein
MKLLHALPISTLLGLAACGGADPAPAAVLPQNAFTGTITVNGTMAAGNTNCLTTSSPVVFTSSAVDRHAVTIDAGGCVAFLNNDTAMHRVANNSMSSCSELTGGTTIAAGNTFLAGPFAGPKTCHWQDLANPPPAPGGGGGGY